MKNIHIIPTDKPSRLIKNNHSQLLLTIQTLPLDKELGCFPQNIYITSDEEIKEGDWFMIFTNKKPVAPAKAGLFDSNCKKIILTTDQDLIKDGVQAIDDTLLEWFVKNPSCEKVEVEEVKCTGQCWKFIESDYEETCLSGCEKLEYKIIIPQEELKQETLEEAAEKQWGKLAIINDRAAVIAFKAGAKWQSERMYSEEDMHKAYCAGSDFDMSCLKDEQYYMFKKWFEQYKKK
jgi:hypothetical protein